ncbi:CoA transferase [Dehalococcoidia bacterium]|nr:CoA transferase [Dehalococcoidia bacterium]MCL0088604.1 CoA transferase [Dehalococcoidia bacterium]
MLALEGIKVIDLTRLAPGPYCTMILADLGADVIKVEEPGPPTGRRAEQGGQAPEMNLLIDQGSPFNVLNRNKRSIGLNLKHEDAREAFYKLAETTDVVVEEFRPGVSKRLGIDYQTLSGINPKIICCAITGYGQDGPYRDLAGHDINYISTAGALGAIGEKGGKPAIPLNLLGDFAGGGMQGAIGILAALMARERTGRGQFVDIAMTDGVVAMLSSALSGYFLTGEVPERGATFLSGSFPQYNTYRCGDGKYLSLGSLEPWFFANLCRAVGREDLIPHAWNESHHQEIFDHLTGVFQTRSRDEWVDILRQTDICVAPVYQFDEVERDPHLIHRQMIVEVEHPEVGKVKQTGISIKLSETPGRIRRPPPRKCQHTDEVLGGLGYSVPEIERLRREGAVL